MDELFGLARFFCILFGILGLVGFLLYLTYREEQKRHAVWQAFARTHGLTFRPGSRWVSGGVQVFGVYRGYSFSLETFNKGQGKSSQRYTRLRMSLKQATGSHLPGKDQAGPSERTAVQDVSQWLTSISLTPVLRGYLRIEAINRIVYEQRGFEADTNYLHFLVNLLADLADAYPAVVALGGEAVPALEPIATHKNHALHPIAVQLLSDIGQETTRRLSHQAAHLFCPRCLTCCAAHDISLGWWTSLTYYGCRSCGQSREFLTGWLVAVLDNQASSELAQQNGLLRVNWFTRHTLFDFDEVEIRQATDEEVERLAVQVGNDTDPKRRSRYPKMRCVISPDCHLSENTLRILRHMFGQVVAGAMDPKGFGNP